jgi:hypothetical protein
MATIITATDLPSAIQSHELAGAMVSGANAKASRVAPCLISPAAPAWAASTAYAVGDRVKLAGGEFLEATEAGTSGATEPVAPSAIGGTVVDGTVTWKRIAPTADQLVEAKLVLIGAVKRWAEAGAGAFQQQTAGPFGVTVDTRQRTGFNLWPSEIAELQEICKGDDADTDAYAVDTVPYSTDWSAYESTGTL